MIQPTHIPQDGSGIAVHASVAALPVVTFFTNINVYLTTLSTFFALVWFGVLLYDRFVKKDK